MPRCLLQEDEAVADENPEASTSTVLHTPYESPSPLCSVHTGGRLPNANSNGLHDNVTLHGKAASIHTKYPVEAQGTGCAIQDGRSKAPNDSLTPGPSIKVCFPFNNPARPPVWNLSATPISVTTNATVFDKMKRRHGGGWPKGKSRKKATKLCPPKPPLTGYVLVIESA